VPRFTSVTNTVAPATAAPLGSETLPNTRPAVDCASPGRHTAQTVKKKDGYRTRRDPRTWRVHRNFMEASVRLVRQPYHCGVNTVKEIRPEMPFTSLLHQDPRRREITLQTVKSENLPGSNLHPGQQIVILCGHTTLPDTKMFFSPKRRCRKGSASTGPAYSSRTIASSPNWFVREKIQCTKSCEHRACTSRLSSRSKNLCLKGR